MKSIIAVALLSVISVMIWGCGKQNNEAQKNDSTSQQIAAEKAAVKGGLQVCAAHNAPKDQCFICDTSLRDPKRLWCKEHARYEDRCWLCHPELQDKSRLYCNEHGLYEDECFLCHPEIKKSAVEMEGTGNTGHVESKQNARLLCTEHNLYEDECGSCHPELVEALEPGKGMKVRFVSKESAIKAGVKVGGTQQINATAGKSYPCRITFNKDQLAEVVAMSPGIVKRVTAGQGEKVRKGQILAQIHSATLGDAQREYLTALTQAALKKSIYEREFGLYQKDVASDQMQAEAHADYRAAQQQLEAARQQLINIGFTDSEISDLQKNPGAPPVLNVRAPFNGTIIQRAAVAGQSVETARMLFSIADLSTMWIQMAVPAADASTFSPGDSIIARFEAVTDNDCRAKVTWVSPMVDAHTRTVTIRALADNVSGNLRDAMFGEATVVNSSSRTNIGVPEIALQRMSGKDYVFVKNDEDLFEIRRVTTGGKTSDRFIGIQDGLSENEQIVIAGSFTVRSELQKAKLGAGCTDH